MKNVLDKNVTGHPNRISVMPQQFYKFTCSEDILTAAQENIFNLPYSPNTSNQTSLDHRLERSPALEPLFNWFSDCLGELKNDLLMECDRIKITQAWSNKTSPGQSHHWHSHPNSFVSGVFYLTTSQAGTRFAIGDIWSPKKNFSGNLDLNTRSDVAPITHVEPAVAGTLVLFPSVVDHCVAPDPDEKDDRFTMSFNTFPEGVIGTYSTLAGLTITVSGD